MTISNYVAVAETRTGARTVGWYGSLKAAREGAERHRDHTGERCYVTDYGREITGRLHADYPATGSKS